MSNGRNCWNTGGFRHPTRLIRSVYRSATLSGYTKDIKVLANPQGRLVRRAWTRKR
jgi:hypothetical protein